MTDLDSVSYTDAPALVAVPAISIVVPTFRERDNLQELVERVDAARTLYGADVELILVDDNSNDGTEEWISTRALDWVRLIVRRNERGLSSAVLEGFRRARNEILVCMDADLSHPPEQIPSLVRLLSSGADFAVGSRFVKGGTTDDDWGIFRWLNSRVATLLAFPLTNIKDPMSGFFAVRREKFEQADALNPVGYKIGLELITKCRCENVREIPIHFTDRRAGQSKLCLREQLRYLQHIRRLYIYRFGEWSHLLQFLIVGLSGTIVNLTLLTLAVALGVGVHVSLAIAILGSMVWNFLLNRRFSFSYARSRSWFQQLAGFLLACSAGAFVNYVVSVGALTAWPTVRPQLAAIVGVVAGMGFNFMAARYWVFKKSYVKPGNEQ